MKLKNYIMLCNVAGIYYDPSYSKESRESYKYATRHILNNYKLLHRRFELQQDIIAQVKQLLSASDWDTVSEEKIYRVLWEGACDNISDLHISCIKVLEEVRVAVTMLKAIPDKGNELYKIIDYYYLKDGYDLSTEEVISMCGISASSFFKSKSIAMNEIMYNLWGYTKEERNKLKM